MEIEQVGESAMVGRVGDNAFGWDWCVWLGGSGECGPGSVSRAEGAVFVAAGWSGGVLSWLEFRLGFREWSAAGRILGMPGAFSGI